MSNNAKSPSKWLLHIKATREADPSLSYKAAMIAASKSYTDKNPNAKPKKAPSDASKLKSKMRKLKKKMDKLEAVKKDITEVVAEINEVKKELT